MYKKLLFSLTLTVFANSAHAGVFGDLVSDTSEGYKKQAASFSDDTLIHNLVDPKWSWLWLEPTHIIDEFKSRTQISPQRAQDLVLQLGSQLTEESPEYAWYTFEESIYQASRNNLNPKTVDKIVEIYKSVHKTKAEKDILKAFQLEFRYDFESLSTPTKRVAIELLPLNLNLDVAYSIFKEVKNSQDIDLLLESSSALLKQMRPDSRRYGKLIEVRREILEAGLRLSKEKKEKVIEHMVDAIKSTDIRRKSDYKAIENDIRLTLENAPKETLESLSEKLNEIFDAIAYLDEKWAEHAAKSLYGSGYNPEETFGYVYGYISENISRGYALGSVSSSKALSYLKRMSDLIDATPIMTESIRDICLSAALKNDKTISDYCLNHIAPNLVVK